MLVMLSMNSTINHQVFGTRVQKVLLSWRTDFPGHALKFLWRGQLRANFGTRVVWYDSTYDFIRPGMTHVQRSAQYYQVGTSLTLLNFSGTVQKGLSLQLTHSQ